MDAQVTRRELGETDELSQTLDSDTAWRGLRGVANLGCERRLRHSGLDPLDEPAVEWVSVVCARWVSSQLGAEVRPHRPGVADEHHE